MRILTIVGARPQFVKAAAVSRALREAARNGSDVSQILVHTGQHYDQNMSEVFFQELDIPKPDFNLEIGSLSHGAQTGRMLEGIERVISKTGPQWVLVYGDTNSTLAGALAAAKMNVPVAHVEAGLRSFNRRMPEEVNRILTDHASTLLFAPTETAVRHLTHEGFTKERIRRTGDVMYDVSLFFAALAETKSDVLRRERLPKKKYVLATIHRAENTDNPDVLKSMIGGLAEVSRNLPVYLPLHPRTQKLLKSHGVDSKHLDALRIVDPVGPLDMIQLEQSAAVIATDSGGVQKEAYFFKIPCVTLRSETEWTELLESGWNRLAEPTSADSISNAILSALGTNGTNAQLYGNGRASEAIVTELLARSK